MIHISSETLGIRAAVTAGNLIDGNMELMSNHKVLSGKPTLMLYRLVFLHVILRLDVSRGQLVLTC